MEGFKQSVFSGFTSGEVERDCRKAMAQQNPLTDASGLAGLVDAAIEIARGRQETLQRLRAALEIRDNTTALRIARELCGLENEQASN
jgi:HEAT repeat protein